MRDFDTSTKIKEIEERLSKIEKTVFKTKKPTSINNNYEGLSGGIQLIIDNGFLNTPKDVVEIISELKRENYHYPKESIRKIVSVDFTKKKRILTRVRENNLYKYVVRR